MNTEVVEIPSTCVVDRLIEGEKLALENKIRRWQNSRAKLSQIINQIEPLTTMLNLDVSDLNVWVTGDKEILLRCMRLLRSQGFKTEEGPPQKGQPQWIARFRAPECQIPIYFSFTSVVCRRVQVGVETKEVPIYEVVCGDISPDPQPEAGVLGETAGTLEAPLSDAAVLASPHAEAPDDGIPF